MRKDRTDVTVILDRSGSMETVRMDTIGGFNQMLNSQKEGEGECRLSLVQFDSRSIDTVVTEELIEKVQRLTTETYQPRGGTPLLDAMGKTLTSTRDRINSIGDENRPANVTIVVITDGEENDSTTWNRDKVFGLVSELRDAGWEFMFLGANQDAIKEAAAMGIPTMNAANYSPDKVGTEHVFAVASAGLSSNRGGSTYSMTSEDRSNLSGGDRSNLIGGHSAREGHTPPAGQRPTRRPVKPQFRTRKSS